MKNSILLKIICPKQLYKSGLKSGKVKITDGVLKEVIKSYVKEAGLED